MVNIDKIKSLARERGIKIKYLCSELGLSETYLSNVKNGRDRMTDRRLETIAQMLNTTVEYLRDETDVKERPPKNFTPNKVTLFGDDGVIAERELSREQRDMLKMLIDLLN